VIQEIDKKEKGNHPIREGGAAYLSEKAKLIGDDLEKRKRTSYEKRLLLHKKGHPRLQHREER